MPRLDEPLSLPVVALASAGETPPAGAVGYWSDGARRVAVAVLSASGRRLFIEFSEDDVLRTNVAGYIYTVQRRFLTANFSQRRCKFQRGRSGESEHCGTPPGGGCGVGCRSAPGRIRALGRREGVVRADRGLPRRRHAGQVQQGGHPQGRLPPREERARPEPRHLRERRLLRPAGAHRGPAGSGLAGVGGQPAREPPRGPLGGQPGQDGQGQRTATVRLLPRLPDRSGGHRSLHRRAGLGGPVRPGVGHARDRRGPAPRGQEGPAARRRGRGGRPFARRFHHHRLRHLGLQRPRGRQRVGRPRLHRRRQQPRTRHPRAGDPIAPGARRRVPLAGLRRYHRALRRPVQHRRLDPGPRRARRSLARCRAGPCSQAIWAHP